MCNYYNPLTNTIPKWNSQKQAFETEGCTYKHEMPEIAQEWFERPAREGYEWKCLNGKWPEEVAIAPIPVATQKLNVYHTIDNAAGQARARFATNSQFIESEYQRAYATAVEYINAGYTGNVPAPVQSHADAFGETLQAAADNIKATGDTWNQALDNIRDIRLKGKQAIENAPDDGDFEALAQPFIDQLEAVKP